MDGFGRLRYWASVNALLEFDGAVLGSEHRPVEFTPRHSGEIRYACGMDMIGGVVFVP